MRTRTSSWSWTIALKKYSTNEGCLRSLIPDIVCSVNKNYKLLSFCQLLVDAGLLESITLYFLYENHAKGTASQSTTK